MNIFLYFDIDKIHRILLELKAGTWILYDGPLVRSLDEICFGNQQKL